MSRYYHYEWISQHITLTVLIMTELTEVDTSKDGMAVRGLLT